MALFFFHCLISLDYLFVSPTGSLTTEGFHTYKSYKSFLELQKFTDVSNIDSLDALNAIKTNTVAVQTDYNLETIMEAQEINRSKFCKKLKQKRVLRKIL